MAPRKLLDPEDEKKVIAAVSRGLLSYRAIGRLYGVSASTVSRTVGSRRKLGARPRPRGRCVVCLEDAAATKLMRFSLIFNDLEKRISRGAGSIDLCERCWKLVAAPRQRRKRV